MQVDDVLRMIDYKTEELDNIFKEFNVLHTEGVDPSFIKAMGHETVVILWLTGINVFQALLIILIVSLCFNQKQKYKRRLKAATIGKNMHAHREYFYLIFFRILGQDTRYNIYCFSKSEKFLKA